MFSTKLYHISLPPAEFQILSVSLKILIIILVLTWSSLCFLVVYLSFSKFEFQPSFLQILSLLFLSLFSFQDSHNMYLSWFFDVPIPLISDHFYSIFLLFLSFRLDNFHCPIFKFSDPFFGLLKSAFEFFL